MTEKNSKKRAKFDKDFKVEACKLVTEQGQRVCDVARNLGIQEPVLGRWVREYRAHGKDVFPGEGKLTGAEQKIKDLENQVRRLTMEREILKKAMAYFVEPPK